MKYFVYRHIRVDNGETFYIGAGSKRRYRKCNYGSFRVEYNRAFTLQNRTKEWCQVVKEGGFNVQILFETNDRKILQEKERAYIKAFGRKDLGEGTLINQRDGETGISRYSHTDETCRKISLGNLISKK